MKRLLCLLVRGYQKFISPPLHFIAGPFGGCRFMPTCSQYFIDAVTLHGAWKGGWLGVWRILRCNPFGGQGYDPPPGWDDYIVAKNAAAGAATATAGGEGMEGKATKEGRVACGCGHPPKGE